MLWLTLSLCCCALILREVRPHLSGGAAENAAPIFRSYVVILVVLALLFAWPPFSYWRFERFLSSKATAIAEGHRAKVHCNTVFDTFFDRNSLAAGHANPDTGEIVFQYPWCGRLMDYLGTPDPADRLGVISLNIFTHESMHVRGERNEAVTECQAVQRNYRAARLLGVKHDAAAAGASAYYAQMYLQRAGGEGFNAVYFSRECAPGKLLDEKLADSSWNAPP
jgi:hypothetical protein